MGSKYRVIWMLNTALATPGMRRWGLGTHMTSWYQDESQPGTLSS